MAVIQLEFRWDKNGWIKILYGFARAEQPELEASHARYLHNRISSPELIEVHPVNIRQVYYIITLYPSTQR